MIKRFFALALGSLLVTGIAIIVSKKANPVAPSLIVEVLRAHNVLPAPDASAAFVAEARKVTHRPVDTEDGVSRSFERKVTVAYNGSAFIHDQVDPQELLKQIDLLENGKVYRTEIEDGKQTKTAAQLGDWNYRSLKFRVMSFGLIPILKQLQDPSVEVVNLERAEENQEKLTVRTASDTWTVYVNQKHLIRRVERVLNQHHLAIEYLDYRTVGGARLPFTEQIFIDGTLTYELFFTRIDLYPSFADNYFSRDTLAKVGVHR